MINIEQKIRRKKIVIIILVVFLVAVGIFFVISNVFGLFLKQNYQAAEENFPNWPAFNITKSITNENQKFVLGDSVDIKITVSGPANSVFTLKDQTLGMSQYDKGIYCLPQSANPQLSSKNNDEIIWSDYPMSQAEAVFYYKCVLSENPDGDFINSNDLPEIAVGQTTLYYDYDNNGDQTPDSTLEYYGGFRGNEAVINYLTQDSDNGERIGFKKGSLDFANCLLSESERCFVLDPSGTIFGLLRGRSYIGNSAVLDLATLLYPSGVIIGDTYEDPSNFYYYGRNLKQSAGNIGCRGVGCASWIVSGSGIESGVQSYYDKDSGFLANFQNNLAKEAPSASWLNRLTYELSENSDPDGKIYISSSKERTVIDFGDSGQRPEHRYFGVGTIFIDGDLIIREDILPKNQSSDFLGFVVTGDVKIEDGADVDAAIVCGGKLSVSGSSRVQLTGSFVASDFEFSNTIGTIIKYRIGLENHWPPGFRYVKMPIPEKSY